ncbi:MAG: hypothetical protein ACO2PN_13055 [Pyrobaculum sp.]
MWGTRMCYRRRGLPDVVMRSLGERSPRCGLRTGTKELGLRCM